jgi:hypothetical protein
MRRHFTSTTRSNSDHRALTINSAFRFRGAMPLWASAPRCLAQLCKNPHIHLSSSLLRQFIFPFWVSVSCSLAVLAAFVLAAALSLRPLYPCGSPVLMALRSSRALSPHGPHIHVGSQSLRRPSPHGFLILVAASSSRLPRPHGLFVLTTSSFSRLPRSQGLHVRLRGRRRLQPSRIAKTSPFSHLHRLSVSRKHAHPPFLVGQARKWQ